MYIFLGVLESATDQPLFAESLSRSSKPVNVYPSKIYTLFKIQVLYSLDKSRPQMPL